MCIRDSALVELAALLAFLRGEIDLFPDTGALAGPAAGADGVFEVEHLPVDAGLGAVRDGDVRGALDDTEGRRGRLRRKGLVDLGSERVVEILDDRRREAPRLVELFADEAAIAARSGICLLYTSRCV